MFALGNRSITGRKRRKSSGDRRRQGEVRAAFQSRLRFEPLEDRQLLSVVTNANDVGSGSLRNAIATASAGDTITFGPSLTGKTITLASGELDITKSLTINNPNAPNLTIDAGNKWRIFDVDDGDSTTNSNIQISGLKLTGGSADIGGAILSYESLTLNNVTIMNSSATSDGGGIWTETYSGGVTIIKNSAISGNNASGSGGGVAASNYGTFEIQNSTISGNKALGGAGGGINAQNESYGTLTILSSTVSNNTAYGQGGGIAARNSYSGATSIQNSTISGNTGGDGGGIWTATYSGGTASIQNSAISGNTANGQGGGIATSNYGTAPSNHGTSEIQNSTISGNKSLGGDGGGINAKSTNYGALTVLSSTVSNNTAYGQGGGIGVDNSYSGATTIQNSTISANNAYSNGGGIAALNSDEGTTSVLSSTIANNTASGQGGGIVVNNPSNVEPGSGSGKTTIQNSTISGNTTSDNGGGIYLFAYAGTIATIQQSTISGNTSHNSGSGYASGGRGGGIYLKNYGTAAIQNSTITGNTADSGGGGVYSYYNSYSYTPTTTPTVQSTIIAGNADISTAAPDLSGPFGVSHSIFYSLVGKNAGSGLTPTTAGETDTYGNLIGDSVGINANLGTLADNGGPTETCALPFGSPAIAGGSNPAGLFTDQRGTGFLRERKGNIVDIGAYQYQAVVTSISPASGPASGSTTVTITGRDFTGATAVNFGATPVTTLSVNDTGTQIVLNSPAHSVGTVDVTVVAPDWTSAESSADQFTYTQATPTITWSNPANITYGTALGATQLDATADVAGTFVYTPASGQVLTAGGHTLSVTFTPTDTADYLAATKTATIVVDKATPTVTWSNPADITYGTALSGGQLDAAAAWTVGGVSGSVAGTFTYTPAAGQVLTAGSHTLSVTFTPTDTVDYTPATQTATIVVDKATPTMTWSNPADITYGTALSGGQLDAAAAWTVGGVSGSVAGTFTYTPAAGQVLTVGSHTLSVTFTPTDTVDYNTPAAQTATIVVDKATPTMTWSNPADIIYGTALSGGQLDAAAAWTVGGVSGSVAGTFTYTPAAGQVLTVGSHTLSVTFTPTDTVDYNTPATQTATIVVDKATPTVTWSNPADITYGAALGATQLDATASVAGTFVYTPASGKVLNAGNNQTLSVTFTPTDTADYTTASKSVSINVVQAATTITWSNPADITYGTALGATQLDATADVAGTFVYTPASGQVLTAGSHTLSVTFTPTDTVDYAPATKTATIVVDKATPTMTWSNPADITYGTALSGGQLDAAAAWTVGGVSGSVAGTFTYTPAAGQVLTVGSHTLSVTFTPTDTVDYNTPAAQTATIVVDKATPTMTWSNPADIIYGTALSGGQLDAAAAWTVGGVSGSVAGTFTYAPAAGQVLTAGSHTLSVTFTPTDTVDYNTPATQTATIVVDKATPTVTWSNPADITYGAALGATQLDATASVAGTFVYTPASGKVLNAGNNQTLSVTFTPTDTADYTTASKSVSINVVQAATTITWSNPADITYGTALGATQLDATADVAGTFVYTPASGQVLTAGSHTLSVTFTPTDTVDYAPATKTATIVVDKATPTMTWSNPADITYGTALSGGQLDAAAAWTVGGVSGSVAGTFTYTPAAGQVLTVGSHTLSVTFTPTDTVDYNTPATQTATIVVDKATPTMTWSNPADIIYGTALSGGQLDAAAAWTVGGVSGSVAGTFTYAPAAGQVLTAGSHTLSVTFTPTDTVDYNTPATQTATIVVDKATPTVTWSNPADITYGAALGATQLDATASVAGTFVYTPASGKVLNAGNNQTLSVTFTPTDATDYTTASKSVSINVVQAAPSVTGISPLSGPLAGGTLVTITGTNLSGATAVKFGTAVVTSFSSDTDTQIVLNSPAGSAGMVDVMVVTPGGASPVNSPADQFSYVAALSALVATPSSPQSGNVTISYTLTNAASNTCSIQVQYSPDEGTTWVTATDVSGQGDGAAGLACSPRGTSHTFVWASDSDFANAKNANVLVRITPTDTIVGAAGTSGIFTVNNYRQTSTLGLYDPATSAFFLRNTTSLQGPNDLGYADATFAYGAAEAGWIPIAGDWDGNGTDTLGLYDPATSTFYLRNTTGLQGPNDKGYADVTFTYGAAGAGWIPIAGDWNGDGKDSIGLYNPATSTFYLRNTTCLQGPNDKGYADVTFTYGAAGAGWVPIAGDWNGDGKATIGLYDPATSTFYLRNTTCLQGANDKGYADVAFFFGSAQAGFYGTPGVGWTTPIAGDWNGDGKDTIGLYNQATSVFCLRNTNDSGDADVTLAYGPAMAGWSPITGDWNGPGQALTAAGGSVVASPNVPALSQTDLQPIIHEAIARWASAGLDAATSAKLTQVQFVVSDLPGPYLGEADGNQISIDSHAAGYGWFVDPTPALNEEFTPSPSNQQLRAIDPRAVDRIDLLTVVEHELGHVLGLKDLNASTDDLMSGVLGIGVRRDPSHQDAVDAALAS